VILQLSILQLSILSPIEDLLTWALEELHTGLGLTWAWSIIALTLIVRVLLVPLTVRQIHSMQRMQQHLPEMKAIQKRYKSDRKKQNEELMKFYRENQINPASSCLPILPQIPIFFALYFVLRHFDDDIYPKYPASALDWLNFVPDITANIGDHWSGYVLLVVYIGSQIASTWFMPMATTSQAQRYIFLALHLVFALFIINPPGGATFPVGLLLYWMTTNLWTVGQGIVTRRLRAQAVQVPQKRSSRTPSKSEKPAEEAAPAAEPTSEKPQQVRRVKRKKKRARR
jgi:YidC/Oxa1 family membrane protein insertase